MGLKINIPLTPQGMTSAVIHANSVISFDTRFETIRFENRNPETNEITGYELKTKIMFKINHYLSQTAFESGESVLIPVKEIQNSYGRFITDAEYYDIFVNGNAGAKVESWLIALMNLGEGNVEHINFNI